MNRIFIWVLALTHATALMSMDDNNKGNVLVSPPPTPRTPRTPTTPRDCACLILSRKCRMHPSERPYDDADHPFISKKTSDQSPKGEIPKTIVTQSSDAANQSSNASNTQN
jgi:hypothetical protein